MTDATSIPSRTEALTPRLDRMTMVNRPMNMVTTVSTMVG